MSVLEFKKKVEPPPSHLYMNLQTMQAIVSNYAGFDKLKIEIELALAILESRLPRERDER